MAGTTEPCSATCTSTTKKYNTEQTYKRSFQEEWLQGHKASSERRGSMKN
jgi:hypothetical protein